MDQGSQYFQPVWLPATSCMGTAVLRSAWLRARPQAKVAVLFRCLPSLFQVDPAKVLVLGTGVAGLSAIATAKGMCRFCVGRQSLSSTLCAACAVCCVAFYEAVFVSRCAHIDVFRRKTACTHCVLCLHSRFCFCCCKFGWVVQQHVWSGTARTNECKCRS